MTFIFLLLEKSIRIIRNKQFQTYRNNNVLHIIDQIKNLGTVVVEGGKPRRQEPPLIRHAEMSMRNASKCACLIQEVFLTCVLCLKGVFAKNEKA